MSDTLQATIVLAVYRLVTIGIGCLIVYFGYRLFVTGVFEKAGELKAAWGERNLTLRQASPGTFLVLFGCSIIVVSLWRGISIESGSGQRDVARTSEPSTVVDSPTASHQSALRISGLGGTGANTPLSVQMRRALSDYGVCELAAVTEELRQVCFRRLSDLLKLNPTKEDMVSLERFEEEFARTHSSSAADQIQEYKRRFVK